MAGAKKEFPIRKFRHELFVHDVSWKVPRGTDLGRNTWHVIIYSSSILQLVIHRNETKKRTRLLAYLAPDFFSSGATSIFLSRSIDQDDDAPSEVLQD